MVVLRKLVWIWAAVKFNMAGINRVKGYVGYMLAVNAAAKLKESLIHIYQLLSCDHKLDLPRGGGSQPWSKKAKVSRSMRSLQAGVSIIFSNAF